MIANRQQRRRAQAERRSKLNDGVAQLSRSGPMKLTIAPAGCVFDPQIDPQIVTGILQFGHNILQDDKPLCLCCDHSWTDLKSPPPAAFAIVRTAPFFADRNSGTVAMFSAICGDCCARHDLLDRCLARYREIWPQLRADHVHHDAPTEAQ